MIPVLTAIASWFLLVLWIPFMWGFWALSCIGGFLFWWIRDREKEEAEKERRRLLPGNRRYAAYRRARGIRVVDNPDGCLDFVRHPDGEILVQTQSDKLGRLWVKYANKAILPHWSDVPSWYPVEQAVIDAIDLSEPWFRDTHEQ